MDPGTAIAVGEVSAKTLSIIWKYYSDVKDAKENIEFLANELEDFQDVLENARKLLEDRSVAGRIPTSAPLLKTMNQLKSDMEALSTQLNPSEKAKTMRRLGLRALRWPLKKKEVSEFVTKLQRYKETLNLAFVTDQTTLMLSIEDERQLAKLPLAADANFDANHRQHQGPCASDTRVDLLQRLESWGTSHQKPIFWLSGMAGTGKSTIARTFADSLRKQNRLGGTFFFSRGSGDLNNAAKFVSTLADQLASRLPGLKPFVCKAIAEHSEVLRQGLRNQWKELIIKPLSMTKFDGRPVLNLVIDALDECDSDDDVRLLLQLFVEIKGLDTVDLGILVTSRPDITIRLGFQHMPEIVHFRLDLRDIPRHVVEHDIMLFVEQELGRIRDERMLPDWPTEEEIRLLVQRSDCLFIYAATVCRFIGDKDWSPNERLLEILQSDSALGGDTPQLDEMYTQVLSHSLVRDRRKAYARKLVDRFREVVGVIVTSFDILSISSLANLLSMPVDSVEAALGSLHSVLDVPIDTHSPIRLLHPSLRDFLIDEARCGDQRFFINQNLFHGKLVTSCLEVLSKLTKNMGDLKTLGSSPQDAQKDTLDKRLPKYMQYSCQYWAKHLDLVNPGQRAQLGLCDHGKIHVFFQTHFLFWLEAMSLIGGMSEAVLMLSNLETMLERHQHPALHASIEDAWRFALKNRFIIEQAPLQTYNSALIFSPKNSAIRKRSVLPSWLIGSPDVEEDWGPLLHTLGADDPYPITRRIALSPDGKLLACTCVNSIKLWNPATGALRSTLEGHSDQVIGLAFSPDGQLASSCCDHTVRLWDPITAVAHKSIELEVPSVEVSLKLVYNYPLIAFAPKGDLAVVGRDTKLRFWDWKAGTLSGPFIEDFDIQGMAFLSDGRLILLQLGSEMSQDREVLLYDPSCDTVQSVISASFSKIAVSLDFRLALGLEDGTILLHDLRTGSQKELKPHQESKSHQQRIVSLCFSSDGKYLASVSVYRELRLHNLMTGEDTSIGNNNHHSAVFSYDGKLLASPTSDGTVQVWDSHTEGQHIPYKEHLENFEERAIVKFSFDGQQLAYGHDGGTIQLWDPKSKSSQNLCRGHTSEGLCSMAFSPDGKLLASGSIATDSSSIPRIRIWDLAARGLQHVLEGHSSRTLILTFSPDVSQLASGHSSGSTRIWDIASGSLLFALKGGIYVASIAFSPNSKQLASGFADKKIRIWDTSSGNLQFTLEGHSGEVEALAFSHSGDQLASGSFDKTVCIWDPVTGSRLKVFHTERFISVLSYSADSKYIETDSGEVELEELPADGTALSLMPRNQWRMVDDWLIHGGRRMLWLPRDVRPCFRETAAQHEGLFAIGNNWGEMTFIGVDPSFSPAEGVS